MSSLTIAALVLVSAALHALWNALIKRERDVRAATLAVLTIAVALSATAALIQRSWFPSTAALACALASGVCEAGYFATLSRSLEVAPLGHYYPIARGGALLIIWPVSLIWLGERAGISSLAGAMLVTLGLFAIGSARRQGSAGDWRRDGLGWALASAVFIASYNLLYKEGLTLGSKPATLFTTSMSIALALNVIALGNQRKNIVVVLSRSPLAMIVAGVVCCLSFWIFLFCLARGGAGAMVTLRNSSVLFAQGFSWWLGERPGAVQIGGASAIAAGAILLTA
jgi:drug/metabolite transporter (DMT)-like permease